MPIPARAARRARAALLASLVVFFGVGAHALRQPGLQYDEAFDAVVALDVAADLPPRCTYSTRLFGLELPLMVHPHIGSTSVYTSLAGISLVGPSVEILRLSQLCVGALALILLFLLSRAWFGTRTAAIAVLLCGSAPGFIWWSRGGANWTVPLLPAALGALLGATHWRRSRQPAALWIGAFAFGIGITTKILFVWLVLPVVLTALLVVGPRDILAALRRTPWWVLAVAAAAFALGLGPLIAANIARATLLEHLERNAVSNPWGHENLAFARNVARAVTSFLDQMDGDVLMASPRFGGRIGAIAFALALFYGVASVLPSLRRRWSALPSPVDRDGLATRTFLVLVPLTVLPQSAVTTSVVSSTYTFLIVPLVWLLVAVMIADLSAPAPTRGARSRAIRGGALALLAVLLLSHVATNVALLRFFSRTGGRGQWSDAIYRTTAILEQQHSQQPVVALDWGFARSIEFLSALRRRVDEGHEFRPVPSAGYPRVVAGFLAPGTVLLAHVPEVAICASCLAVAERVATGLGLRLTLRHAVRDGEGRPHTEIYEVELDRRA